MNTPSIAALGAGDDDFHDSSLVDLQIEPSLTELRVILSTPDEAGVERLWLVTFGRVLRFAFETTGIGTRSQAPVEIYSIYRDPLSEDARRWRERIMALEREHAVGEVHDVTLASSLMKGRGSSAHIEGIQILCRDYRVERAPTDYRGSEFSRPRIEGD